MILEANTNNISKLIEIINENIEDKSGGKYHFVVFQDRSVLPLVKVLFCTTREWINFLQFGIYTAYMKSEIDIIIDTCTDNNISDLLTTHLTPREEYTHETLSKIR